MYKINLTIFTPHFPPASDVISQLRASHLVLSLLSPVPAAHKLLGVGPCTGARETYQQPYPQRRLLSFHQDPSNANSVSGAGTLGAPPSMLELILQRFCASYHSCCGSHSQSEVGGGWHGRSIYSWAFMITPSPCFDQLWIGLNCCPLQKKRLWPRPKRVGT